MKELVITMPDEIFDSVKNMLALIPEVSVSEDSIPEWHKEILDKRLEEFHNNPNNGTPFEEFEKELINEGLLQNSH